MLLWSVADTELRHVQKITFNCDIFSVSPSTLFISLLSKTQMTNMFLIYFLIQTKTQNFSTFHQLMYSAVERNSSQIPLHSYREITAQTLHHSALLTNNSIKTEAFY